MSLDQLIDVLLQCDGDKELMKANLVNYIDKVFVQGKYDIDVPIEYEGKHWGC